MSAEILEMRKEHLRKCVFDFTNSLHEDIVFTLIVGIAGAAGFGISTNASAADLRYIARNLLETADDNERETAKTKLVTP